MVSASLTVSRAAAGRGCGFEAQKQDRQKALWYKGGMQPPEREPEMESETTQDRRAKDGSRRGLSPGSRATAFRPGNRANPNGRAGKRAVMEYTAVPDEPGAPQLLKDMWHVYHRPKWEDRTPGQEGLRGMREKDFMKFLALLIETEKDWWRCGRTATPAGVRAARPAAEEPIEDAGSERAEAVLERLLRDRPWEREGPGEMSPGLG